MKITPKTSQSCPQCKATLETVGGQRTPTFCPNCRFPLALIAGKYRLMRMLAQGGFGIVYLAQHTRLKKDAARVIKVLRPEVFELDGMVARFRREVQVTSTLSQQNEHIVRIYDDFGEDPQLGPYYVMEHLEGQSLRELLDKHGALTPSLVFHIFAQICGALGAGHREGVVHRDLKPENILLIEKDDDPFFVKVIDFGIAKPLVGTMLTRLTKSRDTLGTPAYMAPEQCLNQPIDGRSDIYAMGGILYEMITGTTPFLQETKGNAFAFLYAHVSQTPTPLRERRPDLSIDPALEAIVLQALAKSPDARFSTAEDMLAAMQAIAPPPPESLSFLAMASNASRIESTHATEKDAARWNTTSMAQTLPRAVAPLSFEGAAYRGDLCRRGVFDTTPPRTVASSKWSFATRSGVNSSPAVWKNSVFFGSWDAYFYALDFATGSLRWRFKTGDQIHSSPIVADGQVFFGSNDGYLYALDAESGECLWRYRAGDWVVASPVLADEFVFVGTYGHRMCAIHRQTGELEWSFETGSWIRSAPVSVGWLLFFGCNDGFLYALHRGDGSLQWRYRAGKGVNAAPALFGQQLCFSSGVLRGAGHMYALDALSGELQWRFRVAQGVHTAPAVFGDSVYFCGGDGCFYAVNASDGLARWKLQASSSALLAPSIAQEIAYFGGKAGEIYAVHLQQRKMLWRYPLAERVLAPPVVHQETLLICSERGLHVLH